MRKHKSDLMILFSFIILILIGLIIIYVIGPVRANYLNQNLGTQTDENYFFFKQLVSVGFALAAFIFTYKCPYDKLRKINRIVFIASFLSCVLLMILAAMGNSMATCTNGACRWIDLKVASFQPAEFLKFGLLLYLSQLVARKKEEGSVGTKDFWIPFSIISLLSLVIVVGAQKDFGTGAVILAIIMAILFMSGIKMRQFLAACALILVMGVLSIVLVGHRLERLQTFLGSGDANTSYHIENAMLAIGTGGLTGVGVGNSVQATGYLPESINDSVFAILGETFGFLGLTVILTCFLIMLLRLLKTSEYTTDNEKSYIVVGTFAWIMAHVVINVAAMTGLIPLTGITLPFLSYGGTSMIFISAALGLCLQFSCYTEREVKDESISSGRGLGRSHNSSRRSRM